MSKVIFIFQIFWQTKGRMFGSYLGPWKVDEISEVGKAPIDSKNGAHLMWWIKQ